MGNFKTSVQQVNDDGTLSARTSFQRLPACLITRVTMISASAESGAGVRRFFAGQRRNGATFTDLSGTKQ
jgi:hypothetical protein